MKLFNAVTGANVVLVREEIRHRAALLPHLVVDASIKSRGWW
jgi:hypothetical protein